ncbi:MAG: hypothetical protein ACRD3Q_03885 [Terriglobales bacterium]
MGRCSVTAGILYSAQTEWRANESPTHMTLEPEQTGLRERVIAKAEDISALWKAEIDASRERLRTLASHQVCELARMVQIAMGCAV